MSIKFNPVATIMGLAFAKAAQQELQGAPKVDHQHWVGRRVAYNMEHTTLGVKVVKSTRINGK